jgi:hypothetical protein
MRHVSTITIVFAAALCLAMTPAVLADDVFPPPWRGEVSTTLQYWEFNYDSNPTGWERFYEPDGPGPLDEGPPYITGYLPSTNVIVWPDPNTWYPDDPLHGSTRQGIFPLSGWIDVIVDNHNPPNEFKWVWVQLTWAQEFAGGHSQPAFSNLSPAPVDPPVLIDEVDHLDGWYTSTYEWFIRPNPPFEEFTIGFDTGGGILVDELVIDTWCIPEPATMGLLLVGGLLTLRRRIA